MFTLVRSAAVCLLVTVWAQAAAPAPSGVDPSDAAVALRLSDFAQISVQGKTVSDLDLRRCIDLLRAAIRIDPAEARYPRLLADALLKANDDAGAIEALVTYRKLRPADQSAQLELIQLYLKRIEAVEKKLAYLKDLRGNNTVPAEVRSALAVYAGQLSADRGDDAAARAAVSEAIKLDPLNGSAWGMQLAWTAPGDRVGRITAMLNALRADPAQTGLLAAVAGELASVGLASESLIWYNAALITRPPDEALLLEYASELIIAEKFPEAIKRLDALAGADPENYPAIMLRLILARRDEQKELVEQHVLRGRAVLVNRLAGLRKSLGAASASTPLAGGTPGDAADLAQDVDLYKKTDDEDLKDAYLQALGDLAWFEIYFAGNPGQAEKYLKQFSTLAEEGNPFAARTAGWIFLAQDRREEAKVKLSAVADRDPFAAAGLLRMGGAEEREKSRAEAMKLLGANPAGVLGALLADALRGMNVRVAPSAEAAGVTGALKGFALDWLNILTRPNEFYSIRVEPLKVSYAYREPIWVKVTITNNSNFDLRTAPDGVLKPALWGEVQLQGSVRQDRPISIYERMGEQTILRPRQTVSVTIRADVPRLLEALLSHPLPPIPLGIVVRTNPLVGAEGKSYSAPGGYAQQQARPVERGGSPFGPNTIQYILDTALKAGAGAEQVRVLDLLDVYHQGIVRSPQRTADLEKADQLMRQTMDRARGDANIAVRAYATYLFVIGSFPDDAGPALQRALLDPAWQVRFLGLLAYQAVETQRAKSMLADTSEHDADPLVKHFAGLLLAFMNQPPATQPAVGGAKGP